MKKEFFNLRYIQSVSSNLAEKQRDAFGGNGFYANFEKEFYHKLIKKMRVQSMGAAEFETSSFPDTFHSLRTAFINQSIYLGNFKLKNKRVLYYICEFNDRFKVENSLLNWEENNYLKFKNKKKIVYTKGHDLFPQALKDKSIKVDGWFDVNNYFFFSFSLTLTLDVYKLIQYKGEFGG